MVRQMAPNIEQTLAGFQLLPSRFRKRALPLRSLLGGPDQTQRSLTNWPVHKSGIEMTPAKVVPIQDANAWVRFMNVGRMLTRVTENPSALSHSDMYESQYEAWIMHLRWVSQIFDAVLTRYRCKADNDALQVAPLTRKRARRSTTSAWTGSS
jgi:hypothetical protein